MGCTLQELAERMSAEEYGLWMTMYSMEPWGEDRMDVGLGIIASTLANINRKSGSKPFAATDFAPYLLAQQKYASADQDESPAEFIKGITNG